MQMSSHYLSIYWKVLSLFLWLEGGGFSLCPFLSAAEVPLRHPIYWFVCQAQVSRLAAAMTLAVGTAAFLRVLAFNPSCVPSASMVPTLLVRIHKHGDNDIQSLWPAKTSNWLTANQRPLTRHLSHVLYTAQLDRTSSTCPLEATALSFQCPCGNKLGADSCLLPSFAARRLRLC